MCFLKVSAGRIDMDNPLILASGILDSTAESMLRVARSGAGALVTKSTGVAPREGNKNPVFHPLDHGLLNSMGLPNPGAMYMKDELEDTDIPVPVMVSVFGSSPDEFARVVEIVDSMAISGYELNLSCPNARGYGVDVGRDPDAVYDVVRAVREISDKPIWAKLPPCDNLMEVASAAERAGADAIVAINTIKAMAIDVYAGRPILSTVYGGYSGPGIKPIALRMVYELCGGINIDVIGCGGILTGRDVLEFIMAGASAVEMGSALYYRGEDVFLAVAEEMKEIMRDLGIEDINRLRGMARRDV